MNHSMPHGYSRLFVMAAVSFVAMYVLMYAMVNVLGNVIPNINQMYMAALMTAAMILIELAVMRGMYPDAKKNVVIAFVSLLVLIGSWFGIRTQFGIADTEFLKSMIPHHASALLMCEHASLKDADIKALCSRIVASQQSEIDWMQTKLQSMR